MLGSSFKSAPFVSVIQEQQELIHLATNAEQATSTQTTLTAAYQNFVATTDLTVTSAQTQVLQYLLINHQKIKSIDLDAKVSSGLDAELTTSAANGTYTSTLDQIMSTQLSTYQAILQAAYSATSGAKGHALLKSDFDQASLLIKELNQASGSSS